MPERAIRHYLKGSDALSRLDLRPIFSAIVGFDEEARHFSLEEIVNQLEPHFQRILTEISFAELPVDEEGAAGQAVDCLRALEAKDYRRPNGSLAQEKCENWRAPEISKAL